MDGLSTKRGGPLYWLHRRSRRFWIGVVASLPLLYVVSFGPACWLLARAELRADEHLVNTYYSPVIWTYNWAHDRRSGEEGAIAGVIRWYAMVGCGSGSDWGFYSFVDWDGPIEGVDSYFEWGHDAR